MEEKLAYKQMLKQYCEQIIAQRIAITLQAMERAQEAANQEGKSSAGDKYETARAMSHLEKDMHARQLLAHQQELNAVRAVNVQSICTIPCPGSFVQTDTVSFFIAAGLGKQLIDGKQIVFLSPVSPLAQKLLQKRVGDEFEFKGPIRIVDVY